MITKLLRIRRICVYSHHQQRETELTLYTTSPIKGKFHVVRGYSVIRIAGASRETIETFLVSSTVSPEEAYKAAADMAVKLNG